MLRERETMLLQRSSHFAENDRTRTEMEHENVEHNTEGKIEKRITGKIIRGCLELNVEAAFESVM